MAEITAALVKELREKTGAGMMDCKKALTETAGDVEGAVDWLRKKGEEPAEPPPAETPASTAGSPKDEQDTGEGTE